MNYQRPDEFDQERGILKYQGTITYLIGLDTKQIQTKPYELLRRIGIQPDKIESLARNLGLSRFIKQDEIYSVRSVSMKDPLGQYIQAYDRGLNENEIKSLFEPGIMQEYLKRNNLLN